MAQDWKQKTALKMQKEKVRRNEKIDREQLYSLGQQDDFPFVIAEEREAVIVVKDRYKQPRFGPAQAEVKKIVKGSCKHCGSNRLEKHYKEPAGIEIVGCPVCNRNTADSDYVFDFELY